MYLRQVYFLAGTKEREVWAAENVDIVMDNGSNDTPTYSLDSGVGSLTAAELAAYNAKLGHIYVRRFIRFAKHLKELEGPKTMSGP